MTDTSIGFSNPAYNVTHDGGGDGDGGDGGHHDHAKTNGKQVSRQSSIGEDPDHIEVNVFLKIDIAIFIPFYSKMKMGLSFLEQIKCN